MTYKLVCLLFVFAFSAAPVYPEEIIIWHDAAGNAHTAKSIDEIPEMYRPQAVGNAAGAILTSPTPVQVQAALAEGKALAANPGEYKAGLGLYGKFLYNLDDKEGEAYLFIGTKYGLIRARAALAAENKEEVKKAYLDKVLALDRLYIAYYARGFEPALMLLRQGETVIKGEDGFGAADPGLSSSRMTKSFPYDAIDLSRPAEVEVYNMDGNSIGFELDLSTYK
jgi:hypothetical protein